MAEAPSPDLTPRQIFALNNLVQEGFKIVMLERFPRHMAVEKKGFVALLDPAGGKLAVFGQIGYRMDEGIGMLVERPGGKAFVWHKKSVTATPRLLKSYARVKAELSAILDRYV